MISDLGFRIPDLPGQIRSAIHMAGSLAVRSNCKSMTKQEMLIRCRTLARDVILFADKLPHGVGSYTIAMQLARSGDSMSANYRAACRGRSKAEWLARMGVVEEEPDETQHWLQLAVDCGYATGLDTERLSREAGEILSIAAASIRTGRGKRTENT